MVVHALHPDTAAHSSPLAPFPMQIFQCGGPPSSSHFTPRTTLIQTALIQLLLL